MRDEFFPTATPDLLIRYYAGQCTDTERAKVVRYLEEHPDERLFDAVFRDEWTSSESMWSSRDAEQAVATWKAGVAESLVPSGTTVWRSASNLRHWCRRMLVPIAGTAIAATVLWIAAPALRNAIVGWRPTNRAVEYATAKKQQIGVMLPDGSHVLLAPETQLRYAGTSAGNRQIILAGRAYFTVTHDPARPFVVQTGPVSTRVLGTAFDVDAYSADSRVGVTVVEGKVAMQGSAGAVIVSAGDVAEVTDSTASVISTGDVRAMTEWTRGRLVFNSARVSEVLETLTRWYGYEFKIDSTLQSQRITMSITINDPQKSLGALGELLEASITLHGDTIVLRQREQGGVHRPPASRREHGIGTLPVEIGK